MKYPISVVLGSSDGVGQLVVVSKSPVNEYVDSADSAIDSDMLALIFLLLNSIPLCISIDIVFYSSTVVEVVDEVVNPQLNL